MSTRKMEPGRARRGSAQEAIRQTKPFRSPGQEALIGLLLTTEAVRWPLADLLAERGDLTPQQYNVLRILRGAGRAGLPTLEIAERMVERSPGMTRMIDRLEAKGLVDRERSSEDRRLVLCRLTGEGRKLLRGLDKAVDALDSQVMAALDTRELRTLAQLLQKVREGLA